MSGRKYEASAVTLSLTARVILTVPVVVVPIFLVVQMFQTLASGGTAPPQLMMALFFGLAGGAVMLAIPRVLRSLWAPSPRWVTRDIEAASLERALADALAKDRPDTSAPPGPGATGVSRW